MNYYSSTAKSYNELHGREQLEKAGLIAQNLKPNGLLLDVGAGTGIATAIFQHDCECIALDPSIEMLKHFDGPKVVARAEQLPFKDNSFDAVVSITALHHAELSQAIAEIRRVAKPNARIGISFFKRAKYFARAVKLFSGFKRLDSKFDAIFLKK